MSFIKLDPKCPDISVRRKNNTDNEYTVKVNGEVIPLFEDPQDNNWSRRIYLSEKYGVVIKIDEDYYKQSRNEIVFWTEIVRVRDKRYFAPVIGWGTTSLRYHTYNYMSPRSTKRVFYCVQEYIKGAKKLNQLEARDYYTAKRKYEELELLMCEKYDMSDFHQRQVKVNNRKAIKIHDYGLFGDYTTEDLDSPVIPRDAAKAAKKINSILEKVGA